MEALYGIPAGGGTVARVREALKTPPGYSSVRKLLEILEAKQWVRHEQDGARYVYFPTVPADAIRKSTLRRVVNGLFGGSVRDAAVALVSLAESSADEAELDRILEAAGRAERGAGRGGRSPGTRRQEKRS
jgi:BlaI family penicillinase repressor